MPQKSKNNSASKDGNPRAASTRIGSCTAKKLAGQIRHDLRRGPQPDYVDADRTHLNRILIEPLPPGQMRAICEDRRALRDTSRAMKSNSAIATRGVITFGSEAAQLFEQLSPDQQDAAFREVAEAVAARLATSLHGLLVHLDESTIHAHYELAAYNEHGQPISKTTSPKVLSELQDITAEIMARHCPGIERGTRYGDRIAAGASFADTMHKSVRELHRTLPADLDAKRAKLADLAQAETDAAGRVDEMRARVQKLAEKANLSEKEVKRLATYEKRLSDRLIELKAAEEASEAARGEADRLADLARTDRQDEEAKAEKIRAKTAAVVDAVSSLTEEVSAGTIRRTDDGKITSAAPDRLKPAFPEIRTAVAAAADLVTGMTTARAGIESDQKELKSGQIELQEGQRDLLDGQMQLIKAGEEIRTLRKKLRAALSMVVGWLKRPELSEDMQKEGRDLLRENRGLISPAKDAGDDAPGF